MTAVPRDSRARDGDRARVTPEGAARAEDVLDRDPVALAVLAAVRAALADVPWAAEVAERVSRTQVAFRRSRGFAYLWRPGRVVRSDVPVVVTVALGRRDPSPRWKEVAHPSTHHWVHHLEVRDPGEVDAEVRAWLVEAGERARPPAGAR